MEKLPESTQNPHCGVNNQFEEGCGSSLRQVGCMEFLRGKRVINGFQRWQQGSRGENFCWGRMGEN